MLEKYFRFRFDGFDESSAPEYKRPRDRILDEINTAFLGKTEQDSNYFFSDYVFTEEERCSMFYMLSHNIINTNESERISNLRVKRNSHQNNKSNKTKYSPKVDLRFPVASKWLNAQNTYYSIKEEGVVSFRGYKSEAIAVARVLIGIIAGLTQNIKSSVREVLTALGVNDFDDIYDKPIDPILAMTLADLWGTGTALPNDDKTYFYGINGEWASTICTTHYGLTSVPTEKFEKVVKTNKGTKAEIRGGIDGYLIGSALKSTRITNPLKLRLSTILRSFYSRPKISKTDFLSVSYCDRNSQMNSDLENTAQLYNVIQTKGKPNIKLLPEFSNALQMAQSPGIAIIFNNFRLF
jgi:hypothetical protein